MTSANRNRILRSLPPREIRILTPNLRSVVLRKDAVLYEAGQRIKDVYFPEHAMISYVSGTSDGETIEVSVVGNEGVAGIECLMEGVTAFRAVVLQKALLNYAKALYVQLGQTAVCNKFHSVEERFCRWLLVALDKSAASSIPMTQDALARVLGTRRASVSGAASGFQRRGTIRYTRGTISVLNRKHLEAQACECYETIASAHK